MYYFPAGLKPSATNTKATCVAWGSYSFMNLISLDGGSTHRKAEIFITDIRLVEKIHCLRSIVMNTLMLSSKRWVKQPKENAYVNATTIEQHEQSLGSDSDATDCSHQDRGFLNVWNPPSMLYHWGAKRRPNPGRSAAVSKLYQIEIYR